jgi:hypothetical protein
MHVPYGAFFINKEFEFEFEKHASKNISTTLNLLIKKYQIRTWVDFWGQNCSYI